jgi:transposase
MENQTYRSREDRAKARREMVERYERSGKSQREFCEDEGVGLSTLQLWMRKTSVGGKPAPMALREVEWPAAPTATPAPGWGLELVSPRGWTLRHREALDGTELARLLKSLKC